MAQSISFPMGARFHPCDEEKIQYLLYKVFGHPLPYDDFIKTNDLYGEQEPWEIFGDYDDEGEMYFFTKLKKIGKKNSGRKGDIYTRFSRNVGSGTWTNKGQKVPIYGKKKRGIIGYKRCFRYESRREGVDYDDHNGTWLLQEYTLPDKVMQRLKEEYRDCVLCVLRKKGLEKGVRRKGEEHYRVGENELDYMLASETNYSGSTKPKVSDNDNVPGSETSICNPTIINVFDDDNVREFETNICDSTIINVLDDDTPSTMAAQAISFPMGARFHPCDEEKIQYLLYKVFGHPLPYDDFIKTNDLYGKQEPWEIFGDYDDEGEMYFFTKLKKVGKKTSNSGRKGDIYTRFSRKVGSGTWTNKGQRVPIYGKKKRGIIGYKRCFRYESRREGVDYDDHNGTWLLQEYTLPEKVMQRSKEEYRDCVLCVLRKKGLGKGVRRKGEEHHRVGENELDYMLGSETNYSDSTKPKVSDDDSVREAKTSICNQTIINVLDDDNVRELETSIYDPTIIDVLDDDSVREFKTSACNLTKINVSGDDSVREFEASTCDLDRTEINVSGDDSVREPEMSSCDSTESETSICDLTKINAWDDDNVLGCSIDVECSGRKEMKVMFDLNL